MIKINETEEIEMDDKVLKQLMADKDAVQLTLSGMECLIQDPVQLTLSGMECLDKPFITDDAVIDEQFKHNPTTSTLTE